MKLLNLLTILLVVFSTIFSFGQTITTEIFKHRYHTKIFLYKYHELEYQMLRKYELHSKDTINIITIDASSYWRSNPSISNTQMTTDVVRQPQEVVNSISGSYTLDSTKFMKFFDGVNYIFTTTSKNKKHANTSFNLENITFGYDQKRHGYYISVGGTSYSLSKRESLHFFGLLSKSKMLLNKK